MSSKQAKRPQHGPWHLFGQFVVVFVVWALAAGSAQGQEPEPAEAPEPTSEQQPVADQEAPEEPAEDPEKKLEEIIVTGTRIKRKALTAPVPITTLDNADIKASGQTDLTALAQEIPALSNSITADQSIDFGNYPTGLAHLALRGLGTKRTLVLVNGHRHVGGRAGYTSVDINTIPMALVERVEVLTGGASAVYGADAVSGVVNFIMKEDYQGVEANLQYGISDQVDGQELFLNVLSGSNFAHGRGNATFSIQYLKDDNIRAGDRDFSKNNGIADDFPNPALFYQPGETNDPSLVGTLKGLPEGSVPARVIRRQPTWSISSVHGRIGLDIDGDGWPDMPGDTPYSTDINGNGIDDLEETYLGREGFGSLVYDGSTLRLFNQGQIAGGSNQFGGDGVPITFDKGHLMPARQNVVANATFRYDFQPTVSYFGEAKFVFDQSSINGSVNSFNDALPVSYENPYIPIELRRVLNQARADPNYPNAGLAVTRDMTDLGVGGVKHDRYTFRLLTGVKGELENGWQYEIAFNYGRALDRSISPTRRVEDRWFAALDVVNDPVTGKPVCRSDLVPLLDELEAQEQDGDPDLNVALLERLRELDPRSPPPTAKYPGFRRGFLTFEPGDGQCKPVNLFGQGSISDEAIDFVTAGIVQTDFIEQQVLGGVISGDSSEYFELPAGPVAAAAGFEYRREASGTRIDSFERSTLLFESGTQPVDGSYNVAEGFAEVMIPLLSDAPAVERLSLEGAVRTANYSTVGWTQTWQARTNWSPVSDVLLRGSWARAIRAPNIYELYQPLTAATYRPEDPCDVSWIQKGPNPENRLRNCRADGIPEGWTDPLTARIEGREGGNPSVREETADSLTVGAVVTPRWIRDLSLTVDYWRIKISDSIEFPNQQDIVNSCYDAPSLDNEFCAKIRRNPDTRGLAYLERTHLNIAVRDVRGFDLAARYRLNLSQLVGTQVGSLLISGYGTYVTRQRDLRVADDPDTADPERGELRRPIWAVNGGLRWLFEDLAVNYKLRWMSRQYLRGVEREDREDFAPNRSRQTWVHDVQVNYQFSERLGLFAGVNNLLDRKPFITEFNYPVSAIGRYVYLGMRGSLQ